MRARLDVDRIRSDLRTHICTKPLDSTLGPMSVMNACKCILGWVSEDLLGGETASLRAVLSGLVLEVVRAAA